MQRRFIRPIAVMLLLLPLAGCLDESPPRDFRPVPPATQRQPANECPELSGLAINPEQAPFLADIVDRPAPDAHGLPIVLAFRRGPTQQEMWWVVPRPVLLEFARDLQQREPVRYAQWRELLMRGSLPGSRSYDVDGYLTELARLGPPARVYAGMVSYGCRAHWTLAKRFDTKGTQEGYTQRELWLARDESGDLLAHDLSVRLKRFSVWGDASGHLRVGSTSTWQRLRTTNPGSVEAITDADLPGGEPAPLVASVGTVAKEETRRGACREVLTLVNDFSQRLTATMPAGASLRRFQSERPPSMTAESWPDPVPKPCASVVIMLEIEAESRAKLERVNELLRDDPDVRTVELLETSMGERTVRGRLRVTLQ